MNDQIIIPEESFEDEQHRISEEYLERRRKDRDDDYTYQPSNAILGGIERSLKRENK